LRAAHFCTQFEPEGFRRITYLSTGGRDGPDTTTIIAIRRVYPVGVLSNRQLASSIGDMGDGRHGQNGSILIRKPSYTCFALVAGDLVGRARPFDDPLRQGWSLALWVRRGDEDKCGHAMAFS